MLLLGVVVLLVVAAVAVAVVATSDDEPDATGSGGTVPATEGGAAAAPLTGACENLHAGHGIAMWNPTMADEMTEGGCPFPYEPFMVPLEGGTEDPAIEAPFEPRLYDELWQVFSGLGLGVCQVATLPEEPADGFTFGFRYAVGPAGCPDLEGDGAVVVREYATRAFRDAAAHAASGDGTMVLGRWVLTVEGGTERAAQVATALEGVGAVTVDGAS